MTRITKLQKQIADAHMKAMKDNSYDNPVLDGSLENLKDELLKGSTIKYLMETIVYREVSITSNLIFSQFGHKSDAFKKAVYRGFKEVLNNLNIK